MNNLSEFSSGSHLGYIWNCILP